jgi:thiamine biosynthesis lipoprotein
MLWVLLGLSLCVNTGYGAWESFAFEAMGTEVSGEFFHEDATVRQQGLLAISDEMQRLERMLSHYRQDSQLSRINQLGASQPVVVAPELLALLERARQFSKLSAGAFDITVGSVSQFYDLPRGKLPSQKTLAQARQGIDYHQVILNRADLTVALAQKGVALDLGGIGKGYAVDRCVERLQSLGVQQAAVSAGGDTRLLGARGDRPWWIGIKHPRRAAHNALVLPLESSAISTSGDYERFFMSEAGPVHHILSPTTGLPTQALASVSVLHAESTAADALSTAVFVMGAEAGLALINSLPEADAIVIDRAGQVFYSDGLAQLAGGEQILSLAMPPLQAR